MNLELFTVGLAIGIAIALIAVAVGLGLGALADRSARKDRS